MHRKCIFGTFMMDCALGGSSFGFHGTPKQMLGVSASSCRPVNPLFGFKEDGPPCAGHLQWPQATTGTRRKNIPESKTGGDRFFFRSYWPVDRPGGFCTGRLSAIGHSALPPFLFPGARQVRSRGKGLVGLGNGRARKFLCAPRAPRQNRMFLPWVH
jgi:hypothetical protein